jgi:hypothetical protein
MVAGNLATMDIQRFSINGRVVCANDPQLQIALAQIHETPERPRCLCMPGGVEMYVAWHRHAVVKRMPGSGNRHHPACPSYEPELQQSGLGELVGEAILESELGDVELRVDFPWTRTAGRAAPRGEPQDGSKVEVRRRRMSLRALMHFLFERAGFNRWSPAMEGRRNQGVLHKYLTAAAADVSIKGLALVERLYVPEPFNESDMADAARRRREKLTVLRPTDGRNPLAIVMGEFKSSEVIPSGRRVWIKHMPNAPLLISTKAWDRVERVFAPLFEACDADIGQRVRLMIAALIHARREQTYEIDTASLMLTSEHWIPVEGIHELPLIHALVEQRRRFVKPLRYDAKSAAAFPNALLLDTGAVPVPMHVVSAFMAPKEKAAKVLSLRAADTGLWVWNTSEVMSALPAQVRS